MCLAEQYQLKWLWHCCESSCADESYSVHQILGMITCTSSLFYTKQRGRFILRQTLIQGCYNNIKDKFVGLRQRCQNADVENLQLNSAVTACVRLSTDLW